MLGGVGMANGAPLDPPLVDNYRAWMYKHKDNISEFRFTFVQGRDPPPRIKFARLSEN